MDAYEFSFVAVPAQREAGVLKGLGCGKPKLKELADEFGAQAEYRALYQQAELGKRYQKELEEAEKTFDVIIFDSFIPKKRL